MGSGAIGTLRLIRAAFSFSLYDAENIRLRADVDGGALMDVGCYCVSGSPAARGRAGVGRTGAAHRPERCRLGFAGAMRFPGDVVGAVRLRDVVSRTRDELEAIGSEGSLFLDDPWHCQTAGASSCAATEEVERVEVEPAELATGSSSRTSATRSAATRSLCWAATTPLRRRGRSRRSIARRLSARGEFPVGATVSERSAGRAR